MTLTQDIDKDLMAAMKSGDIATRQVLRMLKSALGNARIEHKTDTLTTEQEIAVLSRELKSRAEAAAEFEKAGAADRAESERAEAKIVENYLPEQLSDEKIAQAVQSAIEKTGASDPSEMGKVMGVLSKELKGKADMKRVNELVREQLASSD